MGLHEAAQRAVQQGPIPAHVAQREREVDLCHRRPVRHWHGGGWWRRRRGARGGSARTPVWLQRAQKHLQVERLGDVALHAGLPAATLFLFQRVGGEGKDGQAVETRLGADSTRRLQAIEDRHLQVHQHHVVGRGPPLGQALDGLQTVVDHIHPGPALRQQLDQQFLVQGVVFGKQQPQAVEAHHHVVAGERRGFRCAGPLRGDPDGAGRWGGV